MTVVERVRENPMSILIILFGALGGFLYGYNIGTISGLLQMEYFRKTFGYLQADGSYELSSNEKSLMVSMLSAGTFLGALLGCPLSDFIGRRFGLIFSCTIFSLGVILETASKSVPLFVIGRVIVGLGAGVISCIVPMYQSECAPKWIRNAIVSSYQWFITIGLFIAALVNNGTKDMHSYSCYRIPIGIQIIWSIILSIGIFFLPESPRFLVLKGRIEQAYESQSRLLSRKVDDPQVENDIKELISNTELMKVYGSGSYAECFRMGSQKNLLRTLVGVFLQGWLQLTGINFIFYYGTTLFSQSGITNPFTIAIAVNLVNVAMTIPGILLMDHVGRRYILIIGAAGMFICQYIIAIVGTAAGQSNPVSQKTLTAFVCIYIAFFAATWSPAAWIVTGELYPISIRAKCMSLSSASNWLFNFALSYATPFMVDPHQGNLGYKIFFVWGSTCLGALLFSFFFIWETKDLSLEQIHYLVRNSSPIKSTKLNKRLKAGHLLENDINIHQHDLQFPTKSITDSTSDLSIPTNIVNQNENIARVSIGGERI